MIIELEGVIAEILEKFSKADVESVLARLGNKEQNAELTFVVNQGMHALPASILKGDIFFFSEGNVDLSQENIAETVKELSTRAATYLRSRVWQKIYLIPSGHPLLVVLATLCVYRITRVNPTVLYYVDGSYREVQIDVRHDVLDKS